MFKSKLFKTPYPKLLGSSVDSFKLAATWRGILKNVLAIALAFAPFLNVSTDDINNLFDSLDALLAGLDSAIVIGLSLWGSIQIVFGAVRKLVVAYKLNG